MANEKNPFSLHSNWRRITQYETSWGHARDEGRRRRTRESSGTLGSPAFQRGQQEGKKEENKRETREKGRMTASILAGGTRSGCGCDGRSASTEPNEGMPLLHLRQLPPLVGVLEMRGYDRPMNALYRRGGERRSSRGPRGPAVIGSPRSSE